MILNNLKLDYKEIFITPNNMLIENKLKLTFGETKLLMKINRDPLIEESKKIFTDKTLLNWEILMKLKKLTYMIISMNYTDTSRENNKKPLIGEDHIMPTDMETNDRAFNLLLLIIDL